ncbi:MAG: NrfD/PsrC family molybdoenzyme membrane anchor subunit [Candidatus Korobacteraceae bacterium]
MFMLEKAMLGGRRYWEWVGFLLLLIATGAACYLTQLKYGLAITGLSRNVSWGLYIAQFTFFVGIAASAVMVVLPCYLHDVHEFHRVTILGEMLAVSAVTMCMLFIVVDMGQPARVLNVMLHPTLHSIMFWDMVSLGGYLLLNAVISIVMLTSERDELPPPRWIRAVIVISIPWAVSIHTVTAFLYSGLPGRTFWLTAILAPRFLASAFAAGPSLLILLCLLLRRITKFDVGNQALRKLGIIVAYAMSINVFFVLLEVFTSFYSGIPRDTESFRFLFAGLDGDFQMVPWMWTSVTAASVSLVLLLVPKLRRRNSLLAIAAMLVFISLWIEKGVGLILGGFEPSPLGAVTRYSPTAPEWGIVVGVWAIGALLITVFYKITVTVREVR